jgi:hypothetical protein
MDKNIMKQKKTYAYLNYGEDLYLENYGFLKYGELYEFEYDKNDVFYIIINNVKYEQPSTAFSFKDAYAI